MVAKSINELKALKSPPSDAVVVVQCLCILLGHDQAKWKTLLQKKDLIKIMLELDISSLPAEKVASAESVLSATTSEKAEKVSAAVGNMCHWFEASFKYKKLIGAAKPAV